MKRAAFTTVLAAAVIALAMPVSAQDKGQAGARPNNGGGASSGSAVSRPSGGGGGSSSGGGSMSAPAGSSSSDSAVARPRSSGEGGSSRGEFRSAPERRGEMAVPRTSRESSASSDRRRVSAGANGLSADDASGHQRAVPAYSRPRDGRPVNGRAVPRAAVPPIYNGGYYYNPYYRYSYYSNFYPYGYVLPGYGFGLGYFYDPWMWGYASPFYYGGYGYGGGSYSGSYYGRRDDRDIGGIRLKVKPHDGQVYVDGYYVGEVDNFDGAFQKLNLEAGSHRIEIRADGFAPEQFEVMVVPGQTITYKGELKRVQ